MEPLVKGAVPKSTFKLDLNSKEEEARSQVVLPYIRYSNESPQERHTCFVMVFIFISGSRARLPPAGRLKDKLFTKQRLKTGMTKTPTMILKYNVNFFIDGKTTVRNTIFICFRIFNQCHFICHVYFRHKVAMPLLLNLDFSSYG